MAGITNLLFPLFLTVCIVYGSESCGKPADVAFAIDSSSSIWIYDFYKQIDFVKAMVKMFDIGPNGTHVAALTFSDNVATEFYFDEFETKTEAAEMVGNITHAYGSSTYTHSALQALREDIFTTEHGMRGTVPKIAILLTDGKSTYGEKTRAQAELAKDAGIKILAIGIGNVNDDELQAVVTDPADKNYFHKNSFSELKSVVFKELIAQAACKAMETSAVLITTTTTKLPSTETLPTTATTETTPTTSTTETTTTTTGESTTTTETTTTIATTTTKPEPEVTKLTATTSTTTTTTQTPLFTSTEMPNEDREKIPQGDQPRCKKLEKADIMFGLHGIGGEDRESVTEFIKAMGSAFDLKSGKFKLGLKENCKQLQLSPTEFGDIGDYIYAVEDVMETELKPLLLHTKRAFRYSRRRADRIAILLISGTVLDMRNAYRIAEGLKKTARIIVIGVGKDIDTEQLKGLASYRDKSEPDISHVFPVIESKNLPYIVKKLNKLICNE